MRIILPKTNAWIAAAIIAMLLIGAGVGISILLEAAKQSGQSDKDHQLSPTTSNVAVSTTESPLPTASTKKTEVPKKKIRKLSEKLLGDFDRRGDRERQPKQSDAQELALNAMR